MRTGGSKDAGQIPDEEVPDIWRSCRGRGSGEPHGFSSRPREGRGRILSCRWIGESWNAVGQACLYGRGDQDLREELRAGAEDSVRRAGEGLPAEEGRVPIRRSS